MPTPGSNLGTVLSGERQCDRQWRHLQQEGLLLASPEVGSSVMPTPGMAWAAVLSLSGDDSVTVNGATYSKKACYLQALKLDPRNARAWNNLGRRP